MFATTALIVAVDGDERVQEGGLSRVPPDLWGPSKISKYFKITKPGWHIIDYDYLAYVRYDHSGNRFIFPGLCVIDGPPLRKKLHEGAATFTQSDF